MSKGSSRLKISQSYYKVQVFFKSDKLLKGESILKICFDQNLNFLESFFEGQNCLRSCLKFLFKLQIFTHSLTHSFTQPFCFLCVRGHVLGVGQCNIFCLGKATAAAGVAWLAAGEALSAGWSHGWRRVDVLLTLGVKVYPSAGSS